MGGASDQDACGTSPLRGVPGTSNWVKAQDSLVELHTAGLPRKSAGETEAWNTLLNLLPPRPVLR